MAKKSLIKLASFIIFCVIIISCTAPAGSETPISDSQSTVKINDNSVTASAEVVAGISVNLGFMIGAEQVDILVKPGDKVKTGDILASFPDHAMPQAILSAKADLFLAQESLDNLLNTDTALAQAVINVRNAKKAYDDAVDNREELNGLITYKETVIKKQNTPYGVIEVPTIKEYEAYADKPTIEKADEDLALKKALLEDAQVELDRLMNLKNSPEVLAAQTRVTALESLIGQSTLAAPFNGTVVELYVHSGELVSPGAPVLLLADLSTMQVKTTDLNEVDVARIHVGDSVKVSFDALPNTTVTGKVSEIALKNAAGSGVYYTVTVSLDEVPEDLRWGMSAFVEIQLSK